MYPSLFPYIFRAPFSGDVTQEITPRFLSPDIKGSPEIEARILREVASYGKQLGKVLEALQALSEKTKVPLPEIDALVAGVERVKAEMKVTLRDEAEAALTRLKAVDEAAWEEVVGRKG
ncbi:hypothetical protein DEA8626_00632 [Defluviimonas aquaemixtae]|uniref:Uncharacterized protein n=1 Tax=Albidovulum aquaemixtae TaxID=1542388 RepID=A0A2R8B3E9_9RHOB|nr:hypothetical protein [Defluviimonas aquaemixtae]SPH17117.1 hypothetical protein DEA8626_00632 [Defluviimonas aquaemixtae]